MARGESQRGDSIQPLSWLVEVSPEWLVERASANIAEHLGRQPESVIGRPLAELLGDEAVHGLRNQLAVLGSPESIARLFNCSAGNAGERFDFSIQPVGRRTVIEAQRADRPEHGDPIATIRTLINRLERTDSLTSLLDQAVRQVRALTGFDRVALYRPNADLSATLAAQTARRLDPAVATLDSAAFAALLNSPAVIADCAAEPVPLVPPGTIESALFPAPDAATRERMRAAGCTARLRFPLTVAGADWGVIMCDSHRPHAPRAERLTALGLYAHMLGLLLEIRALRSA